MIGYKALIYQRLSDTFEDVSDEYPADWKHGTTVQLTEEQNRVYESDSTTGEVKSFLRYRIDIYSDGNTTDHAVSVDKIMAGIGFKRVDCVDQPAMPGFHHKMMRYEAIADDEDGTLYWE